MGAFMYASAAARYLGDMPLDVWLECNELNPAWLDEIAELAGRVEFVA